MLKVIFPYAWILQGNGNASSGEGNEESKKCFVTDIFKAFGDKLLDFTPNAFDDMVRTKTEQQSSSPVALFRFLPLPMLVLLVNSFYSYFLKLFKINGSCVTKLI